jgi:hypothetical protein
MPFTPAHPAILFPFKWVNAKYYSLTALVIGCIVPDFEYFIFLSSGAWTSHTLKGIFTFDLPLCFIIAFIWHSFLRTTFMEMFPNIRFKAKNMLQNDVMISNPKQFVIFFTSSLFGIVTHLVWDSFSHANGYMAHRIPILIEEMNFFGHPVRWCYILWYVSTFLGLIVVMKQVVDRKWSLSRFIKHQKERRSFWLTVILITLVIGLIRVSFGLSHNLPRHLIIIFLGSSIYAFVIAAYLRSQKLKVIS